MARRPKDRRPRPPAHATLQEFFDAYVRGGSQCVVYDDGFRTSSYTLAQLRNAAQLLASRLTASGIRAGDPIAIWGENRPEWLAAFWGCVLAGAVVVPVDANASSELLRRIVDIARVRALFAGDDPDVSAVARAHPIWRLRDIEWPFSPAAAPHMYASRDADAVAEIVFTSGTTGEPKGVVITHRNLLANIAPIEAEALRYRGWLRVAQPLRLLNLLPLSHMFGQALALFLPVTIPAAVVFMRGHNPDQVLSQIRKRRAVLLIAVPRLLDMLAERVRHLEPPCATRQMVQGGWLRRRWHYRVVHRRFGWKFCGFVAGGAQLERDVEEFWRQRGFVVIQGYGLTETAPIVAWNHPLHTTAGAVGKPLDGIEVRIAPDGEVEVRGPTVSRGYLTASGETPPVDAEGWFRTGDIGAFDATGHLVIRGRKKDVIVTPDGLKVFPEDVERVVNAVHGVRESAVIGRQADGAEQIHVVLVLDERVDPSVVVREANTRVETHQRIRDFSIWPAARLPRTEALNKLKRSEIRAWTETPAAERRREPSDGDAIERLLARYVRTAPTADATLDALGLTSLDRIELMAAFEQQTETSLSEDAVAGARTVADLRHLLEQGEPAVHEAAAHAVAFPSWNRRCLPSLIRNFSQPTWILPLARVFMRLDVAGREHLESLQGPVILASNHQSHLDTPAILSALPAEWRRTVAIAMGREFFDPHFLRDQYSFSQRLVNDVLYALATLFFNAFPLPRTQPGARETLRYMGQLLDEGQSVLIFPEGHRTEHGEIRTFESGVGLIASRLRVPVIPVRLAGLHRVLHQRWRWPRRGPVGVTFGPALVLEGADYAALARRVEQAVRALPTHVADGDIDSDAA